MDARIAALGLDAETAAKVENALKEILKDSYVPISRFNEVNDAKKQLETTVAERDQQITDLGNAQGATDDLKKQIETLKAKNIKDKEAYDASLKQVKTDKYINDTLMENGVADAKFIKGVRAYLPEVDIDSEDSKTVFTSKIGEVKSMFPTMFKSANSEKEATKVTGFHPGEAKDPSVKTVDPNDTSWESFLAAHSN